MSDLISRVEALKNYQDLCTGTSCMDCPFLIDRLNGDCKLENFIKALHSAEKTGKWIPCSERLPEDDSMKLVTAQPKKGEPSVNRAYYAGGLWHGSGSMAAVTAWMDLPDPYREDTL